MFKFYDEYYVGFQLSGDSRLAFATPYENNAAGKKRIETVDNWRSKDADAKIYKNEPRYGFKLTDVVSRYSTSNKLFRVLDPHGYELEISADNVLDIALSSGINRGVIADKMVWARLEGKNWLLNSEHPEYAQKEVIAKIKKENPLPGQAFVNEAGTTLRVFYGTVYLNMANLNSKTRRDIHHYYKQIMESAVLEIKRDVKPSLLYKTFYLRNGEWQTYDFSRFEIYRSHPSLTNYSLYSGEVPSTEISFAEKWINLSGSLVQNYNTKFMMFKTKEESINFQHSSLNLLLSEMLHDSHVDRASDFTSEIVYTIGKP